ncbi:hypothetical protein [Natronorarus salvus]|uniref:hypothetical protein n=1 Tax=Natronorarus salvus TaxID=3117733 RepID=UPI002F26696F
MGGTDVGPIEGQVLLLAAAKASVPGERLPPLVRRANDHLSEELPDYRRRYELACETDDSVCFFVETGHWEALGEVLSFDRRETDAVRRAHAEQLRRIGSRRDRREEFDAALEIREPLLIDR